MLIQFSMREWSTGNSKIFIYLLLREFLHGTHSTFVGRKHIPLQVTLIHTTLLTLHSLHYHGLARCCCADHGGGSTEMFQLDEKHIAVGQLLQIGTVYLPSNPCLKVKHVIVAF